jgi:hypothetical protein
MVELNKNFSQVAKAQGKSVLTCIKDSARNRLSGTMEACLTLDRKGKVGKAQRKTENRASAKCSVPPDFGATDPNTVNLVGVEKELSLIHAIFGSDLDEAIAGTIEIEEKDASKCQVAVAKQVFRCQQVRLREFTKCKKNGLKGKTDTGMVPDPNDSPFDDPSDLEDCVGFDPKMKITKACDTKLGSTIANRCGGSQVDLAELFGGGNCASAAAAGPNDLKICLDPLVECEVCLALNAVDDLALDCDQLDDAENNCTCFSP